MAEAHTFYLEIITPERQFYIGPAEALVFPAVDGEMGVYPGHEPAVTAVEPGELRYKVDGKWEPAAVGAGFVEIKPDYVILLVGFAEHPEEIDRKRAEAAHAERVRYNRAYYSLDCDDGIEYSACVHEPSPQELLDRKEMFYLLWNALNSLPEVQGRRVDAYLILGKTYRQIAREEGVDKCAVRRSVKSGITHMKKYLRKNF